MQKRTIAIIGGGAAGLMAAATIAEENSDIKVILIEKNERLGKKVLISGGGRCNVTTGIQNIALVLEKYPRGAKFLQSAMHGFSPKAVYDWFEGHGVPLKIEEDLRVFPQSDDGHDVVGAFDKIFEEKKGEIILGRNITNIKRQHDKGAAPEKHKKFIIGGKDFVIEADAVIITTGGQAYRQTGSTGDGYAFAESLGHKITELGPSLNAIVIQEGWVKKLAGLSREKATLQKSHTEGKSRTTEKATGPLLFTHRGITGPAVFAFSSLTAFENYTSKNPMRITLDMFPDEKEEPLMQKIFDHAQKNPKKNIGNVLDMLVAKSLAQETLCELQIPHEKNAGELSKKDAARIAHFLKHAEISAIGQIAGEEFVTAGGVDLREVNSSTMQSKICPGLFFAGEILDIDGFTGGFNLQAAWCTGHLAGKSATKSVELEAE